MPCDLLPVMHGCFRAVLMEQVYRQVMAKKSDALRLLYRGKVAYHYHFFFIQVNLKIIKLRHTGISAAVHNNRNIINPTAFQTVMDIFSILNLQLCERPP